MESNEFRHAIQIPRIAFDDRFQGVDEFDRAIFDEIWQDSTFMDPILEWNDKDSAAFCDDTDIFPSVLNIEQPHDDVPINEKFLDLDGRPEIGPLSPTTNSDCESPDPVSEEDFGSAPSAQSSIPATSMNSQQRPDSHRICERQPAGTLVGLNINGPCKRPGSALSNEKENGQYRQSKPKPYQNYVEQRRSLACPYRKLDPHRHRDCLKYTLHRIKDVKQHIDRRHRKPDVYCARCYATFPSQTERDEHTRDSRCEILPRKCLEGVTDEERAKLNKGSCRNVPLEKQWFMMWDELFPGEARPRSAFSGNYIEEVIPLIRHCWVDKSSAIIDSAMRGYETTQVDRGILHKLMNNVFDRLEDEVCRRTPSGGLESNVEDAEQEIRAKKPRTH
ncbi:hypothetical protein J7T55_002660 [Diaporthe amygdali]|uniref:uncharacterized protein n=1 Tax=Phomopsis amygdali TaxID=1214568 RepID=UPI0022FF22F3|nr:uncharacterized protein J7T55_002660 [Diaporthe amygdali]KAJ0122148.1 hypothetical protein J7T55_002660 [Diaporthe amygdali]